MHRLHAFLEEMDEEWARHHRRRAQELAACMSLSSGRDSADGSTDVSSQCAGPGLLVPRLWFPCLRPRRTRSKR